MRNLQLNLFNTTSKLLKNSKEQYLTSLKKFVCDMNMTVADMTEQELIERIYSECKISYVSVFHSDSSIASQDSQCERSIYE